MTEIDSIFLSLFVRVREYDLWGGGGGSSAATASSALDAALA
jgi:hypothetical protein